MPSEEVTILFMICIRLHISTAFITCQYVQIYLCKKSCIVTLSELPLIFDHYEYNEERYEMMGMHTRKVYKLGEGLRVRVLDADRLMRTIDFKIVNQGGAGDGEE